MGRRRGAAHQLDGMGWMFGHCCKNNSNSEPSDGNLRSLDQINHSLLLLGARWLMQLMWPVQWFAGQEGPAENGHRTPSTGGQTAANIVRTHPHQRRSYNFAVRDWNSPSVINRPE
ncbi:uncharacterized protein LOC122819135 [Drosophila biarmipes]|uniref:uncharacterized protein LOC122819135 n=1 Tax=Drosophila biarmipes TaxID=125945 RepID=UPI001CDAC117|nr:uncharacterized protein LOC122819135 [Drosophila biarmipes]